MTSTNVTNFRKNIYELLKQAVKYSEPIKVSTKDGNAVILAEEEYNNLIETLYVETVPGLKEKILEGGSEPFGECISIDEVDLWIMK